ncbi:MAG: alpha/beta hydrolase [Planctomycetota bacterium]
MRSVLLCLIVGLASVSNVSGDPPPTKQPLWPGLPPGTTETGDGDVPQLIITQVASQEPTAAVVILPGGGYRGHAMGHEGYDFATWFRDLGVTSAICTYRLRGKGNTGQGYGHPAPMDDAQRAIQTLRANAKSLNIDPGRIGVIGFSAGGHLASTFSTHFAEPDPDAEDLVVRVSSRPDFAILCYPVIAFDKPHTHRGSQRNLLGDDPSADLVASLSNERQVTSRTPPTFLFHTGEDKAVPVQNSVDYYLACLKEGVPAELHVFPKGRHGLGLAQNIEGARAWPALCADWLRGLGVVNRP